MKSLIAAAAVIGALAGSTISDIRFESRRDEIVEKHIQSIEEPAAAWASEMARHERAVWRAQNAACSDPWALSQIIRVQNEQSISPPILCMGGKP